MKRTAVTKLAAGQAPSAAVTTVRVAISHGVRSICLAHAEQGNLSSAAAVQAAVPRSANERTTMSGARAHLVVLSAALSL